MHSSLESDIIFKKFEVGSVWGDAVFHGQDLPRGLSWTEMFEEGAVTLQCFCEDTQVCSPYAAEFLTNSVPPWTALGVQAPSDPLHFAFRGLDGDKSHSPSDVEQFSVYSMKMREGSLVRSLFSCLRNCGGD